MKKALFFTVALVAVLMTVSCKRHSARETATVWLNDFYHMDYDGAKKLSTETTKNLLTEYQQLTSMMTDTSRLSGMRNLKIVVKDVTEKGDTALAVYTVSYDSAKDETLELIKKDDKWLVVFTKEDQASTTDTSTLQPEAPDSTGSSIPDPSGSDDTGRTN